MTAMEKYRLAYLRFTSLAVSSYAKKMHESPAVLEVGEKLKREFLDAKLGTLRADIN